MPDALVAILMGSASDWDTMQHASTTLDELGVPHSARAISAHRTPDAVESFVRESEAAGVRVFIAAAGGAAHLAGVVASRTVRPVLGVPMKGWSLDGLDSLLSTVQMPAGVPVGTLAIGKAGAINAALLATSILGVADDVWHRTMTADRAARAAKVLEGADVRGGRGL